MLSDIVHVGSIDPVEEGFRIGVLVTIPRAGVRPCRTGPQVVRRALSTLVARAESGARGSA